MLLTYTPLIHSPGLLEQGSWVVPYKIMRFAIQSGELLWTSQFLMNFIKTWHTCAKNCFLLTALLLEPLAISFKKVNQILKKKNDQKKKKRCYAIDILCTLISMV